MYAQQCIGYVTLTRITLILESDSPVLILTVRGIEMPSAMPATSLPSLGGLRNSAAPKPRLVASARTGLSLFQLHGESVVLPLHTQKFMRNSLVASAPTRTFL